MAERSGIAAARPLCDRAQRLLEVRRPREALEALSQALAADPGNTEAECLQALALLQLRRLREALAAAERAAARDPDSEWAHRLRAVALREMRRRKEALAAAKAAARHAPDEPAALYVLICCLVDCGRCKEARSAAEELLRLAPDSADTHEARGLIALRERRYTEGEHHFRRALALDPGSWSALNNLGLALHAQGRSREAITMLHQAARAEPAEELSRRNLYRSVRLYAGGGIVATIILLNGWRLVAIQAGQAFRGCEWLLMLLSGLVFAAAVGVFYLAELRNLSRLDPQVRAFYLEERRALLRRGVRRLPWIGLLLAGWGGALGWSIAWAASGVSRAGLNLATAPLYAFLFLLGLIGLSGLLRRSNGDQ